MRLHLVKRALTAALALSLSVNLAVATTPTASASTSATAAALAGPEPVPPQQAMTLEQRRAQVTADLDQPVEIEPITTSAREAEIATAKPSGPAKVAAAAEAESLFMYGVYVRDLDGTLLSGWDINLNGDGCCGAAGHPINVSTAVWFNGRTDDDYDKTQRTIRVTWELITCQGKRIPFAMKQEGPANNWWATLNPDRKAFVARAQIKALPYCGNNPDRKRWTVKAIATLVDGPNAGVQNNLTTDLQDILSVPAEQLRGQEGEDGKYCGSDMSGRPRHQVGRADPVNTATGFWGEKFTDITPTGLGIPCGITRTYASDNTGTGPFGPGWGSLWGASLVKDSSGNATVTLEDGSRYFYWLKSTGYSPHVWVRAKLVADGTNGYALTTVNHRVYTFDASGRLTSLKDQAGQGVTLGYTGNQVTSVTDSAGRTLTLTYEGSLVVKATLADGRSVGYGYTAGRLTSVTALDGGIATYGYDASGRLTTVTDALGNARATNTYDTKGRVTAQKDADGQTTTFVYDAVGATHTIHPDGGIWTDVYEANRLVATYDPFGNRTALGYDRRYNIIASTDALGKTTTFTFDATGNRTSKTSPDGAVEKWTHDADSNVATHVDQKNRTVAYAYTGKLLTAITDASGAVARYTYTPQGRVATYTTFGGKVTKFGYDAAGNKTSATLPTGETTTYGYDAMGRLTWQENAAKQRTSYTYDHADRLVSTTDPLGNIVKFGFDAAGNRTTVTDALGKVTTYAYDKLGRLVSVKDPAGRLTTMAHNTAGNLTSLTDPAGAVTKYTYDQAGRRLTLVTARGHTWKYGYDKLGRQLTVTDPTGATTLTAYDTLGRPVSVTDALGKVTKTGYDAAGKVTSRTDALDKVTTYAYDALDQLSSATDTRGAVTTYGYDADSNLTTVTNALAEKTTYGYDASGRKITMVEPRGNTWKYGYDAAGNQISVTSPMDAVTKTEFDAAGRVSARIDANGRATTFTYDAAGRLLSVQAPDEAKTVYTYDVAGQLTTKTDPNGHVTTYAYDAAARLASVTDPLGRKREFSYDPEGHATAIKSGRGTLTQEYDPAGRLSEQVLGSTKHTFGYDALGRPTSLTDPSGTQTRGYDDAGRLTSVARGTDTFAYVYDETGNITSRTLPDGSKVEATYDRAGRMVTQATDGQTIGYGYDQAGHLTKITYPQPVGLVESREFDKAGRLVKVHSTSTVAQPVSQPQGGTVRIAATPTTVKQDRAFGYRSDGYTFDDGWIRAGNSQNNGDSYLRTVFHWNYTPIFGKKIAAVRVELARNDDSSATRSDRLTKLYVANAFSYTGAGKLLAQGTFGVTASITGDELKTFLQGLADSRNDKVWFMFTGEEKPATWTYKNFSATLVVDFATAPAAPSGVTATSGDGKATVAWAAPADGGSPITGYTVTASPGGKQVTVAGSATTATITGLTNGTPYTFTVTAANAVGTSPVSAQSSPVTPGSGSAVGSFALTLDPAGQPTAITTVRGATSTTDAYAYDPAGRLLEHCPGVGSCAGAASKTAYTYDPVGNRLSMAQAGAVTRYAYDAADQLTSVTTPSGTATAYTYDTDGNQLTAGADTFTYDLADRMTSATVGGKATSYTYDTEGNRLTSSTGSYAWDVNNPQPMLAAETSGATTTTYRYAPDGSPLALHTNGKTSYQTHDWLGGVDGLFGPDGKQQYSYRYDPFGNGAEPEPLVPDAPANPFRYAGEYKDPATGLYNLRARQYDPALGRFTGADPLTPPLTRPAASPYSYVNGRVTSHIDPTGADLVPVLDPDNPTAEDYVEIPDPPREALGHRMWRYFNYVVPIEPFATSFLYTIQDLVYGCWGLAVNDALEATLNGMSLVPGGRIAKFGDDLADLSRAKRRTSGVIDDAPKACPIKRNSFVPGTPVLMADGSRKPIELVKIGDKVVATDPRTGKSEAKAVTALIVGEGVKNLVQITVDGKPGSLTATENHPFWLPEREEWVEAGKLQPGMWLRTSAGTHVQITAIKKWTATQKVHNLTVADIHTYYVVAGDQAILVHNEDPVEKWLSCDADAIGHWYPSTLETAENSATYHVRKHGKGRTLAEYTTEALDLWRKTKPEDRIPWKLSDGTTGWKIRGDWRSGEGIYSPDGRIVTWHD